LRTGPFSGSSTLSWRTGASSAPSFLLRNLELSQRGSRFELCGPRRLEIRCPLAGEHQMENAVTAAVSLIRLGAPDLAIQEGIALAVWPGRLERVSEYPEIILDGAHNPAGARALAAYMDRFYARRSMRLIYGTMRDKAIEEIGSILFPRAGEVILTAPRQSRAASPELVRELVDHPNLRIAPTVDQALDLLSDATQEETVFITGSLFLVAEARERLAAA
jgi:dihydrofolate synthase / folylpolyglutamate synthase